MMGIFKEKIMPNKKFYKENQDKCKENSRDYYKNNQDKWVEYRKAMTDEQKEERNRKRRERYAANPDKEKERSKKQYEGLKNGSLVEKPKDLVKENPEKPSDSVEESNEW
jgi:nucleosome binding factor SPN SPT16 subunit|tara:strand:- start:255 stop:584 length:330 start_codon:yes stop_codon:yes gene_type:complete